MEQDLLISKVAELVKKAPTPFFIFWENAISEAYKNFTESFSPDVRPELFYSVKTNYQIALLKSIRSCGCGAEVSSELDLKAALAAGFSPDTIIVDGFRKHDDLLQEAIRLGVSMINVESLDELPRINALAASAGKRIEVGIRCQYTSRSFEVRNLLISLGVRMFREFGVNARDIMRDAASLRGFSHIRISSLMVHNTLPFTQPAHYAAMMKRLFALAHDLYAFGIEIKKINLGGGLSADTVRGYDTFATVIRKTYRELTKKYRIKPVLVFEPGRLLVENAGVLVGKIIERKGRWLIVDFSKSDYGVLFPFKKRRIFVISKSHRDSACEFSGRYFLKACNLSQYDTIMRSVKVRRAAVGDHIVLADIGAYSLAFSCQFTKPRPAVYMIRRDARTVLIRKREECADVLRTQVSEGETA